MGPLGVAAAVTGMLAWVIAEALSPLDARLDTGEQHLVQVLRAHTAQLYAAALLAVLFTLAQRGPFAPDGIIAALLPLTTVIWILALAATLPRSRRTAATVAFGTGL